MPDPGHLPLPELPGHLISQGRLSPDERLTIVGADSVRSEVRDTVRGDVPVEDAPTRRWPACGWWATTFPYRLGRIEQYRVSKLLGSVVDYRSNPNGYAEVDCFLPGSQHRHLEALGASPARPTVLTPGLVRSLQAPLFERLVDYLRDGLTRSSHQVFLQSTFRLEHRYIPRVSFRLPGQPVDVFLVGDAAVSLPFFRGMACLVRSVHSLARALCDIVHLEIGERADEHFRAEAHRMLESENRPIRWGPG